MEFVEFVKFVVEKTDGKLQLLTHLAFDHQLFACVLREQVENLAQVGIVLLRVGDSVDAELAGHLYATLAERCKDAPLDALVGGGNGGVSGLAVYRISVGQGDVDDDTLGADTWKIYRHLAGFGCKGILNHWLWERTDADLPVGHLPLLGEFGLDRRGFVIPDFVAGGLLAGERAVSRERSVDDGDLI